MCVYLYRILFRLNVGTFTILKDVNVLVNEMVNSNLSFNVGTFTILIDALCKEGRMEAAEDLFETI